MQHDEDQGACGNPSCERSLLGSAELARWRGLGLGWIEASPHQVHADVTTERNGLVMIDAGATQADFLYGARSMSCEFRPGSIGFFAAGTELKASRWRWARARRIYVDLETDVGAEGWLASMPPPPRRTEIEFRDAELTSVLRAMVNEAAAGNPNGPLYAQSLSLGVVMRLGQRGASPANAGSERGKLSAAQVRRIEELVESQLSTEISLTGLAAAAGFSPSQFARLFKRTLGCTPHQYVLRRRLERTRELVVGTDLPLALVAAAAGFASQSHMTSAFVRTFKAPPGQMRRGAKHARA